MSYELDREEADVVRGLSLQCRVWAGASFAAAVAYVVAFARLALPTYASALLVVGAFAHTVLGILYAQGGSHLAGATERAASTVEETMRGVRALSRALFVQAAAGVVAAIALAALFGAGGAR